MGVCINVVNHRQVIQTVSLDVTIVQCKCNVVTIMCNANYKLFKSFTTKNYEKHNKLNNALKMRTTDHLTLEAGIYW